MPFACATAEMEMDKVPKDMGDVKVNEGGSLDLSSTGISSNYPKPPPNPHLLDGSLLPPIPCPDHLVPHSCVP